MNIIKSELGVPPQETAPPRVEDFETAFHKRLDALVEAKERWSTMRAGIENGYAVDEEAFAKITQDLDSAMEAMGGLRGVSDREPVPSPDTESSSIPPRNPDSHAEAVAPASPEPEASVQAESVPAEDDFEIEFVPAMEQRAPLTLDEIEQQYREARTRGETLEQAYWEKERDDFIGRHKALEDLHAADRLEMQIAEKRRELQGIDPKVSMEKYAQAREAIQFMESDRKQLLKPGIARRIKNGVNRIFEKATFKAKERWREVPEPAKNIFTLGGWFVYETEKLRRDSKDAGATLQKEMEAISEERNMSPAAAQEEATMIQEILKREGHAEPSPGDYDVVDRLVTESKRKENEKHEDEIVAKVIGELKKKMGDQSWLAEYGIKDTSTLTSRENLRRIEEDIRKAIRQLRDGQARRDVIDYTKVIRRNLNQVWWRRAVYWGVDRAVKMFNNSNRS